MTTYISDRGEQFDVSQMESSHLINVIKHHQGQVEALRQLSFASNIIDRRRALEQVIDTLAAELAKREPQPEEYLR